MTVTVAEKAENAPTFRAMLIATASSAPVRTGSQPLSDAISSRPQIWDNGQSSHRYTSTLGPVTARRGVSRYCATKPDET